MGKAMPERWKDYDPIGARIEGTKFVPFKVPLRKVVSIRVESGKRLDDRILLERIPNLGLIIDMTNTNRFYDPIVFQNEGIQYEKLMIPGRVTPSKHLADNFVKIVKKFTDINKHNDKLIGVHCTHGVNRTGYMICYYMISQMAVNPKEAMDKFSKARGYEIERENYIKDLQKLQICNANQNWRTMNIKTKNSGNRGASNAHDRYCREIRSGYESFEDYKKNGNRKASSSYRRFRAHSPNSNKSREYCKSIARAARFTSNCYTPAAERCTEHYCRRPVADLDYTRPTFESQQSNNNWRIK